MKIYFLPKSRLGRWTAGLSIYSLFLFIFGYIFAELSKIITSDILITIAGASSVIASIVSFITGIIAVIKNKERSILVFLGILLGLVVLVFIFGNILGFPDAD
ncbi:MAG: hypothetical protein FIA99_20140 [Ruminiclostridium sp.]|nr:hypothetical protein [Ruminiclostridium sp.]